MALLMHVTPSQHNSIFPEFEKPCLVGEMYVERDKSICIGRSKARYLVDRLVGSECHLDLNMGYSTFESKDALSVDGLLPLLKWIEANSHPGSVLKKVCHEADFVCYRGILAKIASTPYNREGWRFVIVRYKDVNFICEFPTDERIRKIESMTEREKLMSYWGFKMEQYVTSDSPEGEPNVHQPVSNIEEFNVIMKAKLGNEKSAVRILYIGETDCIDRNGDHIEIKTQLKEFGDSFNRFKAMNWWLQSYLFGIQNIIAGIRDDNGIVTRVERVKVSNILKHAEKWSPNVTFNFLLSVLLRFREILSSSNDLTYYLIEYEPERRRLTMQKLPEGSPYAFLNSHFIEFFNSQ